MEIWIAVILMFGGPTKAPQLHTISGPPVESFELCRDDALSKGVEIFYKYKAPQNWKLLGVFCSPILEKYRLDLGESASR
tara:strand:- start:262 stop:501 length:240 start_codon:yes stop_codon:yes gene_type:complete